MVLINTLFTLCHCVTKIGNIFWTGIVFPNRSSVFVPEWPKGEFVSILYWLHSGQTKTLYVMVAF
jgi:hypothetical protein